MQLKLLGYRTLEAESGQEALEICARECPDLILMDVSMPDLDGLGTTRLLRQAAATMYIPIVAFSAFHSSDFRECALAAGCNDFVTKPIEMKNLDDIIARNLGNHAEI
jgi:CheY-like chemotaxis protein